MVLDRQEMVHQLRAGAAAAREMFDDDELEEAGILEAVEVRGPGMRGACCAVATAPAALAFCKHVGVQQWVCSDG